MALHADTPRVAMQVSRGVVVASIQVDLDEEVLAVFQEDLLGCIHESGSRGAILDVSGLETLDAEELASLRRILSMVELMGARGLLVGLQPGVVSALMEANAEVDGLQAASHLDAAFDLLELEDTPLSEPEPMDEPADAEEPDPDAGLENASPAERSER